METMLSAMTINRECQTLRSWENGGAVLKACCYWNCWKRLWKDVTAWKVVVNTHGVERTKHGLSFRHADVEERQARQSFPSDSRCPTRCVHLNQPEIWVQNHHSFQQPLRLLLYLLPQTPALFSFYRWGNRKGSTPCPSSRGCSISEQGSQLMIQGFFSRLLANLHLIPFFSNFLVHISPRTVVIRWLS